MKCSGKRCYTITNNEVKKLFSERYGYVPVQNTQYDSMSDTLRNRIWNTFYSYDILSGGIASIRISNAINGKRTIEAEIADRLGFTLGRSSKDNELDKIKDYIMKSEWYKVYDFIEIHLQCLDEEKCATRSEQYNSVLEHEKAGYRIINCEVSKITDKEEISEIVEALSSQFDSVNRHLAKALSLYSDIENPDYENSIKESISAVEAMCCHITGEENTTLGKMLNKLIDSGINIHSAMEEAFKKLYGYTSDEGGIRHGSIEFVEAPEEDARYMLITCSAFINYLKSKMIRINDNDESEDKDNCLIKE